MSVWSTVSTLGQMVQGTLEQALGDEDEAKNKEEVYFVCLQVN